MSDDQEISTKEINLLNVDIKDLLKKEVNRLEKAVEILNKEKETLKKEKEVLEISNKLLLGNNKFLAVSLDRITEMTKNFDNLYQNTLKTCNQLPESF